MNYIRDTLAELPRVEQPARGAVQIWRYVPPELDEKIKVDEIEDWILSLDIISSGNSESERRQRAMIQQAYDHLVETEKATKEDIQKSLPSYTAHYLDFEGFWSSCLMPAFSAANDVDKPTRGHQYWYYTGGNESNLPPELDIEIESWVQEQDIPGQGITVEQRQSLLQFSYNYLQRSKRAMRSDFEEHFKQSVPGYTGQYRNFDGLWSYLIKDGLKKAPGVETHQSGKSGPTTYQYVNGRESN